MLLTGPPGTGKTLTAESIADRLQLPLYAVSANELGDTAKEIEGKFNEILRLAAAWNAVLLLDEADAFLEKRVDAPEARDRNKRVAGESCSPPTAPRSLQLTFRIAFLQILVYYKGILILTTNRHVSFDDAFYSHIQLTLQFKALSVSSREVVWKNFLRGADISSEELSVFAAEDLNGRQIKNVMKMARFLAKDNDNEPLRVTHIRDVLAIVKGDLESDE